jgi:heat shock protein HslJ/uncharacterized protein YraI
MKTIPKTALLVVVLLILVACQPVPAPVATPLPVPPTAPPPMATPLPVPPTAPAAGFDLAETSWVLSSLDGALPLPVTTVTLELGVDGAAFGSDGCNRFRTSYVQDGNNLTFKQPAASTMMACPEPVMNQATAFMDALARTTNFVGDERQLILRADNQIVATFVAAADSLADTAWDVLSYNNGREAVVSLILGTEISANFGAGGELTGNAGCNEYITDYSVSGNNIKIGVPGTTFRFCSEPPGVMEQESEYLAALQSAATYSFQGDLLEMRSAMDQTAVVMVRKAIVDLPEPAPEPATPTGRVTGTQGLNVRSGPGVNFPVIGFARSGDEGEIVGRNEDSTWWAVAMPSAPNGAGWVAADFVLASNIENVPVIAAPPPPTAAPTARPTAVPPVATPTPPPAPTATSAPNISFSADRTTINQGECTTLRWSVHNVQAVWVYPQGQPFESFPRTGEGSETVCPATTTTYEIRVQMRDGSTVFRQITINVIPAAPTATPVPAAPTATPVPPPAPDPLANTRWDIVNFNNGQAIVTLIAGSSATLDFGTGGQVSGRSGCNNFSGPYRTNANNLSVGPLGGTSMSCPEPAGVMEQEAQILKALQSAATFRINGNMLEIKNAAGSIAIVASRAP